IIEFSFRGLLNQLNPSSYAPVMAKTGVTVASPVDSPPIVAPEVESFLAELGAHVEMHGGLFVTILCVWVSCHLRCLRGTIGILRSCLFDQGRPILALEAWAIQSDEQRATLWHVVYDTQRENLDLRRQLAEESSA
ncbi:hypothetical protein Tco_0658766, partial [Tanacetum coccineum]